MSQNETWYFSYGSNLSKQQMLRRTGSVPTSFVARLTNYRLAFRKVLASDDVFATIIPAEGSIVHGVAYCCSPHAMVQLDRWEGVAENCYRRESVSVETHDGKNLSCIVYIGEAFAMGPSFPGPAYPSPAYLNSILTGAQEHQLPADYIQSIELLALGKA